MTRDEFITGYMTRSKIDDYSVDGERVYWGRPGRYSVALPCKCGEEGCDGWALIPPSGKEWGIIPLGHVHHVR